MRTWKKLPVLLLALVMIVPAFAAMIPVEVNAASSAHVSYASSLDFEDAIATDGSYNTSAGITAEGKLSADYIQGKLDDGFSATIPDGISGSNARMPDRDPAHFTVVKDSTTGNVYIKTKTYDELVADYAASSSNTRFPMLTLWDEAGLMWSQPYEYSFDIMPENTKSTGGTLIHISADGTFKSSTRTALIGFKDSNILAQNANGTSLGVSLAAGQWNNVRVQVYPNISRVLVWFNGKPVADFTHTNVSGLAATNPAAGGISIGWSTFTYAFALDNISWRSLADTAAIREHIDFSDAQIDSYTQSLGEYLAANAGSMTTGVSQFVDSASTDCYGLVKDGDEWVMYQDITKTPRKTETTDGATEAAVTFKDATNLSGDEQLEIVFDFKKNSANFQSAYNTVRIRGGSTVAPLTFREGKYISVLAEGFAVFRKTDSGYAQARLVQNQWYSFKVNYDLKTGALKLFVNEGRVKDAGGDPVWEPLYFLTNGTANGVSGGSLVLAATAVNNTYPAETFDAIMTTEGNVSWWYGAKTFSSPTVYMLHGTNDAWNSYHVQAYMDNLAFRTADGNLDVSLDFAPAVTPANTDWWENSSFVNADSKKASAKLTDFRVVDAPAESGTYGKVIQPKVKLGAFCFDDTKDLLPSYVFDVSYDLYMTNSPSSNVHLLKLWAPYDKSDSAADAMLSTLVLNGYSLKYWDNTINNMASIDVATSLVANKWYNIRVRFDLVKGYYMAYLDGRLIHTQNILEAYPERNLSDLKDLHFEIHNHYSASVLGYHYLDNIRVDSVDAAVAAFEGARLIGVQQSKSTNSVRLIAGVNSLDYSKIGFEFELLSDDGAGWVSVGDSRTDTVYTQITADGETVKAAEEKCLYFVMAIITDIDSDGILCVRPFTVQDGVRCYGEEGIYSMKVNDGSLLMQKTEISSLSSAYTVYAEESYENAPEKLPEYSATPSATDAGYYRLGGQMAGARTIGVTTLGARVGSKALTIQNLAPNADNAYSARLKLNHLMPFDIESYINYDVKITAYVKLADLSDSSRTVPLRLGLMGDKGYTEITYKTNEVRGGEWSLITYEGHITQSLIDALGEGYPARVFIGLGNTGRHAGTVMIDDITVALKPSVGVTMPSIFADGMMLQRNKSANVWGWDGVAGDTLEVSVSKDGSTVSSARGTVDANGEFSIALPAMNTAGTGYTLSVSNLQTGSSVAYNDVAIGDIWYCSGQSNMELKLERVHNIEDILADADNCEIRSFKMSISSKYTLQKDVSNGVWKKVDSSNANSVSGIAYITAYQLHKELGVPVAVIESYNGGSAAEPWLSYDKLYAEDRDGVYNNEDWIPRKADGSLELNSSGCEGRTTWGDYEFYWQVGTSNEGTLVAAGSQGSTSNRFAPTGLYNGMQGPLAGYALAGAMWYQGESRANSLKPQQYNYVLNDLIDQWREDFCDDQLPVVIFQLAPYSDYYNLMRQVQLDTAKRMDHVYTVTTAYEGALYSATKGGYCLDLDRSMSNGWGNAIHPGTKRPVAERAANTILANEYGLTEKYGAQLNPEYQTLTVSGNVATMTFSNAVGLKVRDGDAALTGFRAYAADGTELTVVSAVVDGTSVVLTTETGTTPTKITYAFDVSSVRRQVSYPSIAENDGYDPQYITVMTGNLENGKGQPAIPFMASLSDVSLYEASAADGKLYVEIRELGHLCSSYKLEISVNGNVTEHVASFATAGNYVIDSISVSAGDAVVVTLKTADGATVLAETTVDVK